MSTKKRHQVFELTFETENFVSTPEKLGLDAIMLSWPETECALISMCIVQFSKAMQHDTQMSNAELLQYAKTTFLGTSKIAVETKQRTILGVPSIGEIILSKIPIPSQLEIHFFETSSGTKYCVAFRTHLENEINSPDAIIAAILESIKV